MQKTNNKFVGFIKRNAFYLILALCIIAVGASLLLILTKSEDLGGNLTVDKPVDDLPTTNPGDNDDLPTVNPGEDEDDKPSDTPTDTPVEPVIKPISFAMPVGSAVSIVDYSDQMVWNATLNRYSAHKAIDFICNEGEKVLAVMDGKVSNVENTLLKGTTITIDHGNGLFTIYNSLLDGDSVSVGKEVKQGEIIGEVSSTNRQEADKGFHLHFEVIENGQTIDPEKYLTLDNK